MWVVTASSCPQKFFRVTEQLSETELQPDAAISRSGQHVLTESCAEMFQLLSVSHTWYPNWLFEHYVIERWPISVGQNVHDFRPACTEVCSFVYVSEALSLHFAANESYYCFNNGTFLISGDGHVSRTQWRSVLGRNRRWCEMVDGPKLNHWKWRHISSEGQGRSDVSGEFGISENGGGMTRIWYNIGQYGR